MVLKEKSEVGVWLVCLIFSHKSPADWDNFNDFVLNYYLLSQWLQWARETMTAAIQPRHLTQSATTPINSFATPKLHSSKLILSAHHIKILESAYNSQVNVSGEVLSSLSPNYWDGCIPLLCHHPTLPTRQSLQEYC